MRPPGLSPAAPPSIGRRSKTWPFIRWLDLVRQVVEDLERNPSRSMLTMLGLVIGSAAVVAVTSVGLAGRNYAIRQLDSLGTNLIWVSYTGPADQPAGRVAGAGRELDERDYRDIRDHATALAVVSRTVVLYTSIFEGGRTYPITLVGTDGAFARVRNLEFAEGRGLVPADVEERRKVCVLEQSLARKLFGRQRAVGRTLKIEDFDFAIIGVFRDVHTPGVETEISQNAVLIPISVARFFTGDTSLDTIYAQSGSPQLLPGAVEQIRRILAANHGGAQYYSVNDLSYFVGVVKRISVGLMVVVFLLALIALVVGGVGILNIMLISVRERTREIGTRVALGARRREILRLFALEALIISLAGGVIGVLLGSLGPLLVSLLFGFSMPVSLVSLVLALAVSLAVGLSFGVVPALNAARIEPAAALRYE
jgi:putative ABC transport system permease protein